MLTCVLWLLTKTHAARAFLHRGQIMSLKFSTVNWMVHFEKQGHFHWNNRCESPDQAEVWGTPTKDVGVDHLGTWTRPWIKLRSGNTPTTELTIWVLGPGNGSSWGLGALPPQTLGWALTPRQAASSESPEKKHADMGFEVLDFLLNVEGSWTTWVKERVWGDEAAKLQSSSR